MYQAIIRVIHEWRRPWETTLGYIYIYSFILSWREKKHAMMKLLYVILKGIGSFFYFDYNFLLKKHLRADYPDVSGIILAILLFLIIKIFTV